MKENANYQILSLMSGITPYIVKFAGAKYPREIRIEIAFIVTQIFSLTKTAIRLFIAGGGILVLPKFLDLSTDDNEDINLLAIDCAVTLIQYRLTLPSDLLSNLTALGIPERLAVVIDSLSRKRSNPISYKFLLKAFDVLLAFGTGPAHVQEKVCEGDILPLLFDSSRNFNTTCLHKLCCFLSALASNPSLLNCLENVGVIPFCFTLIRHGLELKDDSAQVVLM